MTNCGCYAKMEYAGASHTVVLCPLHASAAELAERVAELEAERDKWQELSWSAAKEIKTTAARVAELEAERDRLFNALRDLVDTPASDTIGIRSAWNKAYAIIALSATGEQP